MSSENERVWAWIRSLSWQDLRKAAVFRISPTEHDSLQEMVRLQVPPPTPVHPRVYRPASVEDRGSEKDRWRKPRMFQFFQGHVLARKFTTPSGDRWTLGCTEDQRQADDLILRSTNLLQPFGTKDLFGAWTERGTKKEFLRTVWIASRGYWIQHEGRGVSFCAPWLDPFERWFSLSMYLASRYEVALKETFQRHKNLRVDLLWEDARLADNDTASALQEAVAMALRSDVLVKDASLLPKIRDTGLWKLLLAANDAAHMVASSSPASLQECPLIEMGSAQHQLRMAVVRHYSICASRRAERALLDSIPEIVPSARRKRTRSRRKRKAPKKEQSVVAIEAEPDSSSSSTERDIPRNECRIDYPLLKTSMR